MHAPGHLGAALLSYAPFGGALLATGRDRLALLGALVAVGCSSLPDVDEFLPRVEHRGPTHTLWFAAATGLGSGVLGAVVATLRDWPTVRPSALLAGGIGFGTVGFHVAVDALTPMGIRPLAPLSSRHVTLDVVLSRDRRANALFLVAGVLASAAATALGRGRSRRSTRGDEPEAGAPGRSAVLRRDPAGPSEE